MLFWKRPKKVALVELPKDEDILIEANLYMAWQVGRIHGQQAQGKKYAKVLQENADRFRDEIKPVIKAFLKQLDASLD
jgi:hypothetical protein